MQRARAQINTLSANIINRALPAHNQRYLNQAPYKHIIAVVCTRRRMPSLVRGQPLPAAISPSCDVAARDWRGLHVRLTESAPARSVHQLKENAAVCQPLVGLVVKLLRQSVFVPAPTFTIRLKRDSGITVTDKSSSVRAGSVALSGA